jgi:hypothetical protein
LIGLSFGALLVASGSALWSGFRPVNGLARATRVIGWVGGGLLLIAFLLLWITGGAAPILSLTLMAAIAAPLTRRHSSSPWYDVVILLPALALAGGSFSLATGLIQAGRMVTMSLAVTVCGGLAARVLGQALGALVDPTVAPGRLFDALYLVLTLLVGAYALTGLWRRGVAWEAAAGESGLAGAWLAWSAAWMSPRQRPRLRAGLIVIVALLLIVLVFGTG